MAKPIAELRKMAEMGVFTHSGSFHADDVLSAALLCVAGVIDNPSIYIIYRNGKYRGNCKLHWNFKYNKVSVEMSSFFGRKQDIQAFLDVCLKIDRLIAKSVNDITG